MAIQTLLLGLALAFQVLPSGAASTSNLTVGTEPQTSQPYVLPYLARYGVHFQGYVVRFPVTNLSTEGAISLLTVNGPQEPAVPVHIHTRYHETFFMAKGAAILYTGHNARRLGPLDIASVPPNTNHSFQLLEPDTEILGAVTPGGFSFYQQIGYNYTPAVLAPFPVDPAPIPDLQQRVADATGTYYDYVPQNTTLNTNLTNGTPNTSLLWHNGNNTLPGQLQPYYIAGGWGPKYLNRPLGQVVAVYMTGEESAGILTIATITMRKSQRNETSQTWRSENIAQIFRPLEGQLHLQMQGQNVSLTSGDTAMVPPGVAYRYWSEVPFTRFYTAAAPVPGHRASNATFGLVDELLEKSEPWRFAVFPDYLGAQPAM